MLQIYNQYSQDLEMVRAVLCAGLFPSVVQCKPRGKRTAFFTKEDGKVEPHPASVNARVNSFPRPWLVYGEKVKTSAIYVRDSTNVSDYALLMFGGNLTVSKNEQGVEMLGGYLQFQASKKTLQLVQVSSSLTFPKCYLTCIVPISYDFWCKQELRRQLDLLLDRKVKDPQFDIHKEGKPVVTAVLELLQTNGRDEGNNGYGNYSSRR